MLMVLQLELTAYAFMNVSLCCYKLKCPRQENGETVLMKTIFIRNISVQSLESSHGNLTASRDNWRGARSESQQVNSGAVCCMKDFFMQQFYVCFQTQATHLSQAWVFKCLKLCKVLVLPYNSQVGSVKNNFTCQILLNDQLLTHRCPNYSQLWSEVHFNWSQQILKTSLNMSLTWIFHFTVLYCLVCVEVCTVFDIQQN